MMSSQEWRKVDLPDGGNALPYTTCGLDNIFLVGGFTRHQTPYGDGVSIVNVEGLHRSIADWLIASEDSLSGKEIRFLRKEMKLTQAELGELLKVTDQQVARWEKGECPIPGSSDILLRALYKHHVGKNPNVRKISEKLRQTHRRHDSHQHLVFTQEAEAA